MPEITGGGYAVEYICRLIDETEGKDAVPESATTAQGTMTGTSSTVRRGSGAAAAKTAKQSNTAEYANAALKVAMPVLNAVTNGAAGQTVGVVKKIGGLVNSVAIGAGAGGLIGAGASLAAWGIGEIVNNIMSERAKNDALADSLDDASYLRQTVGLDAISYSQSGITKKITYGDNR